MNTMQLDKKIQIRSEIIALLDTIPIFDKLSHKEAKIIAGYLGLMEFAAGETLFKEGDKGDYLCFIIDGKLEVIKTSRSTDDVIISTVGKGRSIGEMSVVDDYPRSATVKCKVRATLVALTRERFDTLLDDHPHIGVKVMRGITRLLSLNLRKTSSRLADYMMPLQ